MLDIPIFARLQNAIDTMVTFSPEQEAARQVIEGPARHSCIVGGTRSGKTFLIVRSIVETALRAAMSRHALLRFRANAARASLALDTLPTVMRMCFPGTVLIEHRQDGFYELPNGSQIWIGGLDDKERVEKILGTEFLTIFLNEASQIPYASYLVAMTRLAQKVAGERQRAIVDLNPVEKTHWTNQLFGEKRDPITKRPLPDPENYDRAFLNPMANAANLSPEFLASLANMPDRQRRRFYEGVYVEELEGALWTAKSIDDNRVDERHLPSMQRIVVAVDPATTVSDESDETGIVVVGLGQDGHGYLLEDASGKYTPTEWASKAVALYHRHKADRVVAETNQGGLMVETTVRMIDPNVSYKGVNASRGKYVRAEPCSALYERGRVHHVGVYPELEDQLVSFTPGTAGSPDRLDALVWALTELMVGQSNDGIIEFYRVMAERPEGAPDVAIDREAPATVRMLAPAGLSHVSLMSGRGISIGDDRVVECSLEDAKPLRALGWQEEVKEPSNG